MKKSFLLVLVLGLVACAPPPPPTCTVSWQCGNGYCAAAEGAWSGTGQFTGSNDESDCLIWSTAFLNAQGYPYNRVSSCSCNN